MAAFRPHRLARAKQRAQTGAADVVERNEIDYKRTSRRYPRQHSVERVVEIEMAHGVEPAGRCNDDARRCRVVNANLQTHCSILPETKRHGSISPSTTLR
jgi:hypothetical protein